MKALLFAVLTLASASADAQSYSCPAQAEGARLSGAEVRTGQRLVASALHGDVEQVEGGTNIRYNLPEGAPRWLVCQYGGKRVEGTAISSPQVIGAREAWIQLGPRVDACDLAIREAKPRGRDAGIWTAGITCQNKQPPPPDMM